MIARPSWLTDVVITAVGFGLLGLVVIGWLAHDRDQVQDVGQTVIAKPSPKVQDAPKETKPAPSGVRVYKGGAALKDGLKLPRDVVDAPSAEVIASSTVKADDHAHTVTTVIDTETGESITYDRREPLPWLAWSDKGSVGMYAGVKNGEPAVRLQAHQELFTVKALRFGATASIDQPINGPVGTDYFIGVGAEYRW